MMRTAETARTAETERKAVTARKAETAKKVETTRKHDNVQLPTWFWCKTLCVELIVQHKCSYSNMFYDETGNNKVTEIGVSLPKRSNYKQWSVRLIRSYRKTGLLEVFCDETGNIEDAGNCVSVPKRAKFKLQCVVMIPLYERSCLQLVL